MRAGGCTPMSPELRAGNASLRAGGDETLDAVQHAAAAAGQFLPVDADGRLTVRELLQRRDGGPLEAQYGRLRDRVLAAGINGLSLGSEAVKDVAGYDLRRLLFGSAPVDWAVFRLARLPERRERLLARGGDAFALAEELRADPAAPPALVVLGPALLVVADDCGADEQVRRRGLVERRASEAGAELEELGEVAWLGVCADLPTSAVRMTARTARIALPAHEGAWAYDAGRRLALVTPAARDVLAPARSAPPASPELVAAVLGAVRA
jgi:FAD/FMN-containing dehydrogenase